MPEALVVYDPDVDVGCELLPGDAGVHGFVAVVVVSSGEKLLSEVVYSSVFLREPEKRWSMDIRTVDMTA